MTPYRVHVEQDISNRRYKFVVCNVHGSVVKISGPRYITAQGALRRGNKWAAKQVWA